MSTTNQCESCKKPFESEHGKRKKFCQKCSKERIKKQVYQGTIRRMIRNRELIKSYKDKKECEICGYNKHPSLLAFHHKNKSTKNTEINKLMKTLKNPELIKTEIKKCILLCPNCHGEIHLKERNAQK